MYKSHNVFLKNLSLIYVFQIKFLLWSLEYRNLKFRVHLRGFSSSFRTYLRFPSLIFLVPCLIRCLSDILNNVCLFFLFLCLDCFLKIFRKRLYLRPGRLLQEENPLFKFLSLLFTYEVVCTLYSPLVIR